MPVEEVARKKVSRFGFDSLATLGDVVMTSGVSDLTVAITQLPPKNL
jgi:hypothetical protein